jgi:hypothetical protein
MSRANCILKSLKFHIFYAIIPLPYEAYAVAIRQGE